MLHQEKSGANRNEFEGLSVADGIRPENESVVVAGSVEKMSLVSLEASVDDFKLSMVLKL